jgi:hypothetical protein
LFITDGKITQRFSLSPLVSSNSASLVEREYTFGIHHHFLSKKTDIIFFVISETQPLFNKAIIRSAVAVNGLTRGNKYVHHEIFRTSYLPQSLLVRVIETSRFPFAPCNEMVSSQVTEKSDSSSFSLIVKSLSSKLSTDSSLALGSSFFNDALI